MCRINTPVVVGFFSNSMLISYESQGYPDRGIGVLVRISTLPFAWLVLGRPSLLYQVQASCVNQKYDSSCPASKRDGMMQCAGHTSVALCPDFPTDHVVLRLNIDGGNHQSEPQILKNNPASNISMLIDVTPQPRFFAYGVVHHLGIISYRGVYVSHSLQPHRPSTCDNSRLSSKRHTSRETRRHTSRLIS